MCRRMAHRRRGSHNRVLYFSFDGGAKGYEIALELAFWADFLCVLHHLRFDAMDVTNAYEFVWFGAMGVTKPREFMGFQAMDVTTPYEFIGFGASLEST